MHQLVKQVGVELGDGDQVKTKSLDVTGKFDIEFDIISETVYTIAKVWTWYPISGYSSVWKTNNNKTLYRMVPGNTRFLLVNTHEIFPVF